MHEYILQYSVYVLYMRVLFCHLKIKTKEDQLLHLYIFFDII